jgi:cell wall-associated NlpC family hydrolase
MIRLAAAVLALLAMLVPLPGAPAKAKPSTTKAKAPSKKQSAASTKKSSKKQPTVTRATAKRKGPAKRTVRRASAKRAKVPAKPKLVIQEPALTAQQCALGVAAPDAANACVTCSEQALVRAYSLVGLRYRRGGTSVETGFDCSGFVRHVFGSSCQLQVPRSASQQYQVGLQIDRDELQRGDLVFFRSRRGWHVGIYTGDGQFIHSPNRRDSVKVSSLASAYYRRTYLGARRLTQDIISPLPAGIPAPALSESLAEDSGAN